MYLAGALKIGRGETRTPSSVDDREPQTRIMKKDDWYGIGVSLALHLLLLVAFGIISIGATELEPLGYIEVDFGPVAQGRPVQRAVEDRRETEQQPEPEPEEEVQEEAAPPEEAKPAGESP